MSKKENGVSFGLEGDRRMGKMKKFTHERTYEEISVNMNILGG